jgi:hypothetical protein
MLIVTVPRTVFPLATVPLLIEPETVWPCATIVPEMRNATINKT